MHKYIMAISLAITALITAVSVQAKIVEPYFAWPVSNHVGSTYWGHHGRDYSGDLGETVKAAESGTVFRSSCKNKHDSGHGCFVILRHRQDYKTMYANMQEGSLIKLGSKVQQGDAIGKIGMTGRTTGPHLHFEIRKKINGKFQSVEPLDYQRK